MQLLPSCVHAPTAPSPSSHLRPLQLADQRVHISLLPSIGLLISFPPQPIITLPKEVTGTCVFETHSSLKPG